MTFDDAFFNRTGLERIGVVGLDLDSCWASLRALDRQAEDRIAARLVRRLFMWHSSTKARKNVGRRGLRPWPLQRLSQFLAERKDRLLRGRMFLRTFHRWDDLVFIVHIIPNWRVVRILSHWMRYFLPLSDFNKGY